MLVSGHYPKGMAAPHTQNITHYVIDQWIGFANPLPRTINLILKLFQHTCPKPQVLWNLSRLDQIGLKWGDLTVVRVILSTFAKL